MVRSKICFKCGGLKPLYDFYRHPRMADGHLNKCKACTKRDSTRHRNENIDQVRQYDRDRAKNPERAAVAAQVSAQWRQKDKRRVAAHNAVARAIRKGTLVRQPCERCGAANAFAHHEDYDKKLEVFWLCQPCHKQRHKELASLGRTP